MCGIWLLGTILPFAFFTILGEASADVLGATAIVSMMPTMEFYSSQFAPERETFVLRTVILQCLLHAAGKCGRLQGKMRSRCDEMELREIFLG
jgi:hypothetical protein